MRFSIIVPAYNAAPTLPRCLDSILKQRFEDYQVLVVDDGSADDSRAIATEYAARDSRFALISTPHRGAGAARNAGLEQARGDYVLYMDADDYWLAPDLLAQLSSRIDGQNADIYMFRMVKVTEDGQPLRGYSKPPFALPDRVLPLQEVYQDLVRDGHTLAAAWNKCVRRSLMLTQRILFREDLFCEDIDWVLALFSHVQSICLVNLDAYAYTQHPAPSRSSHPDAPNDLVSIVLDWGRYAARSDAAHSRAVAGLVAFEYGICMGNYHLLTPANRTLLRQNRHLLSGALDKKALLIRRFSRIFGFRLTAAAVGLYLLARKIR